MWAWGPRPCGPQSQKDVANPAGWTACAIKWQQFACFAGSADAGAGRFGQKNSLVYEAVCVVKKGVSAPGSLGDFYCCRHRFVRGFKCVHTLLARRLLLLRTHRETKALLYAFAAWLSVMIGLNNRAVKLQSLLQAPCSLFNRLLDIVT